jgi:hypothetical protein
VQNGPTTLSISRKSAIARFIPVTLFLSNVIGAVVYVIRASMGGWVDPRTGPASVSGEPFIWFLAILPVVVFFFALNLAWMIVIVRRRWRVARRGRALCTTEKMLLTGFVGLSCSLTFGQTPFHRFVHIAVSVTDTTGAPIPHSHVVAVQTSEVKEVSGDTNDSGNFDLRLLTGNYNLSVSSPGFRPSSKRIQVHGSRHQSISFVLSVAACPPGICDTVRITDAWPFELSRPVIQQMIGEK